MEPEVRIALSPPPAQATAHQAFRRLLGRSMVREGVFFSGEGTPPIGSANRDRYVHMSTLQ